MSYDENAVLDTIEKVRGLYCQHKSVKMVHNIFY
jgi:hypothetical protein